MLRSFFAKKLPSAIFASGKESAWTRISLNICGERFWEASEVIGASNGAEIRCAAIWAKGTEVGIGVPVISAIIVVSFRKEGGCISKVFGAPPRGGRVCSAPPSKTLCLIVALKFVCDIKSFTLLSIKGCTTLFCRWWEGIYSIGTAGRLVKACCVTACCNCVLI